MAERPLYTLYKNLKAQNYDVPNDYNKFESALTRDGKSGADNRHAIYENLKAQNFDVPDTYERFYSALFEPRSKTSSRAKGGSVPMSAADRARFSAGAAAISASAKQIVNNAGRYNRLKQRKQKQQKDFGRVNLGTHLTPFGSDANNVVKDEFAYNPETGKAGAYVTSDNKNAYTQSDAEQKQAILDQQDAAYQQAVDTGEIPSAFDVRDKNGNYDLQENIGKNGTYLTEEGAQKQFDKKLADAYARKKEIEALIAEDNRQHGNPLLSYGASIGASNGRTAEQSDYRNKLATSLSLVTEQIGALEAVKQYPTSSWGEDALKALDNTAFTAKTWDFGLTDFATMGQMERIKTKMDNNLPLSGSDKMLLKSKLGADAAAALEDEKMGNVYRWTKIAGQSLPFMTDFFLTGGYGGITKGISRGALKFAAKRGMGKVSAAILKNTGIVAGDVVGSYAMAGTEQALKTGADIMQRHLGNLYQDEKGDYKFGTFDENGNLLHEGGESIGTALYKGMTSAMVENYTEKLFGHNYGIKKGAIAAMEKHGMDGTAQFFKNIGKSGWYTNSKKWMEKFGINGFGEEVMEEEIGIPLHALLDGDNNFSDLGDAKQQLDIIGGMAISVGSMYAMGAGSRPVKGIYNRAQYYRFRNKVNVADNDAQSLLGDNWADIKDKIDNATNEQMGGVLADILRQRDTMNKEQINAAVSYGVNLMKMRGYNIAKTAEMNAREITNEPTTPEEQHQTDIDNAYSEGHDADDADKHDIQIQQEDQTKTLAAALGISEQQLSAMSDEELESLTGQDDKLDQAIYDYQLSSARYQGVVDDAQDKVDLAAHQAGQRVDMYTDRSRGSVRNATIKASGGAEDYGVYIISGNIATHEDGSIDVSNSDDMILYYDPTTNGVEHADALMFAELGEELPADDVKAQAINDAKENAIKKIAGIIDGTVEAGSQFSVTDADGTEHIYEVLADNGDGTAMITIDGNVPVELVKGENVQIPYPFADLQQMKDMEDQKRLETAKAEREQMEKERAAQQTQETEQTPPSFDFNQILNDNGNVVLADVLGKDGNTKYPNSQLFLIRDSGAKAKVMELKSDGTLVPHAVNKKDVRTATTMSIDEYKQAFAASSMIEDNSGENRGEIEVEPPTIEGETDAPAEETAASETTETPATEQTPVAPAITLEDGTEVPMLEDGNPDFSKLTAAQTAELYDNEFGEDADSIVSGYVSDAKKALDKANNMTVKGKTFVEQKASKDAKEKAIADAQAAYDSAIAIRDAYNERQLAKVEDTAEGRKELIEKARRKFARLKSAVKDDAEAVAQLYKEAVGSLLHRLYDGTGIDVTDTIPLTAEEYVASNLGAHSLNYEGTETSKGVKQETGLSREDFVKTQLLAADGKGTTIDALVHSLWENRPSNLDSLDTQDIRNALIGVLTSGFKASEARSFIENIRIAQAEKLIEGERTAAENAAYYEQQKAKEEEEKKKAELEKKKAEEEKAEEEKTEENENTEFPDKLQEGSKAIEAPEDATDEKPLGEQLDETDLPFSAKENGKQQTTAERTADVEKNKVDDMKVVDNIIGQKTRKTLEKLAKMMGANVQWQYSDKNANGWFDDKTNTIYLTLDSSITEGVQFIFGHEMTHEMRTKNPAAYDELKTLVEDMMGEDAFNSETDRITSLYNENNVFYNGGRTAYEEEVVADQLGKWIRDANYTHTLLLKMSHSLLAKLHEIVNRFLMALHGIEISDDMNLILRSIEQAYVKTANGEVTNSETGEDVSFSLRQKPEPKKKGIGYKVFVLKDGKLYPPMVANPNGAATPVGVWLDADAAPIAGESKTGRPQVKQGGKGTQGGSGKLAYRPGWHLGVVPYAIQFNRKDADGNKTLFPKNFVFAEVEYAADVDYQEEARQEGINPSGKYQHSLAGLKHLPTDGYYMYRTNPNPETDPWVITGAMKVNRILTRAEQADLVSKAGREPQQIQEGDIVTDDVVKSINQEIADAPKFSLKDNQGNPLNQDGTLKLDKIKSVDELTDEDFLHPTRNVELPSLPKKIADAIGTEGKPVVIKKNIFERNYMRHKDVTPELSKTIFKSALYNTDLYGQNQKKTRPYNWVLINTKDEKGNNRTVLLEVNPNKDNVEIVHWHFVDERGLEKIKKQADREDGQLLILPSDKEEVGALSDPTVNLSAAKIDNSSETAKENGEKFSLKDDEYLKAVENGDMEKAQKMVNEAAEAAGYSTDSSYQGTSAFNGSAPWGNGYFLTKEERKEAWDNDEYDGDQTLGDYIHRGIDAMNLDFIALDPRNYRAADPMRKEAIDNVRNAIQKKSETITMYRSVPSDVKEGSFRNGDWVTPSRAYAVDNAKVHGWGDNFNIIEQKVPVDEIWWDGNDIAEWGYGREEDYVNDTDFAYKNTKNNRKLLDAVTYDDNGNVIPLSQRFNENNADVRYSLKDEKTMFGMHNISLDKLRKAIKQGGFAAPSMGVIDSKNGIYSGYGEITLIPKAEKIAKRTGKNIGTYAADAWTPIYPPVEKKFGGNGGDVAYDDIESVPKEMQSLTRNAINSFMDGRDTNSLAYLYLHEKGKAPELVHVEGKYPKELHDEVKGILGKLNGIYNTTDEQKEKLLDLFIREVYDGNKEEFDNDIKKFIKKNEEFIKKRPNSNISKDKQLDVDWMKEHGYDYGALSRFVDGILRDAETSGKVDENATMKAAQQYIQDKGMKEDFDSWKEKLNDRYQVEEVIFAGYKDDGNRKYLPNTVENAVKVMKQDGKNASVGSASFSHFVASILKPMGTLDQIRKKKGNLTGNYEDVEKFQEKWQPVYDELADNMQPDAEPFESYGMDRLEEVATQKNPKKYAKEEYGVDLTDEDINKLNELIEAVKNDKPSIYFETKFMRPYGLDEFEKAIVPNDTPSDVVDALKMAGIDVSSYERGNAEDRQKVTMDAINSSDNIRFSLKSMMAKPEGWKQANKKAIHIAEAIERDPKFSLKNLDGTLIKAGTYFSGGGLVEEGLKGIIDPVVAVEYDEKISGVYRNNFGQHIVTADVRDVDPKELVKQIDGEVEYFHASPVCKNYSQAKSNHAEVELDKETAASTAEFINAIKPKVVTIENVKGYKDSEAMKTITDALDANGYTWDADVYNAADYGGYTNRERLIVRAVRDGKLPEKPKKMARKSGWYEAVADIIPTLTEKKNGVAPWMDIRLKADGIDWRNIDKPLYVMGSAYADGKIPHAFADELLPTLRTKSGDVIVMPDGKVYRAMGRVLARVSGVSDDYKMPFSESLSHTIIGNGIPTQLTEHVIAPLLQNTLRPTTPEDGNTRFSLRYDKFEHDLNQWKKDNNLPKDAQRPIIPQRNAGESAVDFLRRVDEYRKQMALWKTAPTYEQHLLSDDTALGEFNRELQKGSVLKRIAFQDSMLAIRKAQEAIMKEVGVDRLNMAEDAYTAENRSHGKGKNEFEEYNNEFLQPLRKAYHQMKKVLGDSYDNVRIYMMAKHGLERDAQMAFKKSLEADYEDVAQRSAAYKAYKGDMNRIINDSDLEFGRVDFTTWRQRDNALRVKYSPSYMNYRYDKMGIAYDYSGLSALFDGSDFEEAAHKLIKDIESKYVTETHDLWDATNAATKKILRDGYKAGMMSKDTYQYVRDMYSHYIPLRGWDGTTADQVWDYIGGGKGAFNQTLKKANGRTSIADDPIAYIENMAESGILLNNKNWVKQHLMLLAQNHPTSLLTLSKAWYVKSVDDNGNEEWIPATPQITSQMDSNQVKAAIDAFEKKMEQMAQTGDATQKRDGLNIAYPQTHSEEREHEVRVMKDGEEYVIYVNGDPQLAQAMNNTRAHRVSEGIKNSISKRVIAVVGRKMAAAYTSLSPLFIPSNYFRDLTMTLASTAIREDGRYNYLLRKNLATSWNLGFMLKDYQNGKLKEKVSNGNATPKEQMFYDFMMNGGETGFVSSLDVEDLKKKFKNDLKDLDRWKANPVKVGHTIMDSIEFLNRAIEDSNRFAVYMTSIQYGRSIDEAVNDAKNVTLNFNRKGTGEHSWQTIRNLYLFINPAVQSLQTLGALVKHHPFKFTAVTAAWLASGVLVPIVNAALMQMAAAFGGGDGDDDKEWYKDISKKYWHFTKWDRRNNLIMWVPFTHEFIKIPLAQEFRAFYGVGDMIASKMMGGELAEQSWEDYGWDLLGQVVDMLPLDPTGYDSNILVSICPNAIRPIAELAFNVDFTGKPLFKDTEYNKYDPNFTKAYVGTPDWLVRASKMVNSIGNDYPDVQQNSIDAFGDPRYNLNNPAVVDHVLSSYLGGAYTMGSQVLGVLTKSLNDPKEIKVADIPLFSKFVSNPDDRPVTKKQGDEFWNMKENHDRAANTLSKLKKQAKVDGDYSMLERFYGSEEYKQYKKDDVKVKKYEEDKKKERAEESGEEYRPHKLNAEDIYKAHATPKDDFEDLKLKQLYTKLNGFKSAYDLLVDTAPSQSDGYYNTNKAAIDAIDEISLDKQEISELKKGFLDDGKDAYNAEDMKQIRELRKNILSVLEKANKVVVANQKAKAKKK